MRYPSLSDILKKTEGFFSGGDKEQREADALKQRVIQFTDIEDTFLDIWLQLENAGKDELAAKVINAGLLFEHYLSQLADDPANRTAAQAAQLESFRMDAQTALDAGRAALVPSITPTPK